MAQYSLVLRRYAPFDSFGGGFEGDNRQFSTSLAASARTAGVVTFGSSDVPTAVQGKTSGSAFVGPWSIRKSFRLGSISKHIGQVRVFVSNTVCNSDAVSFTVETSGNLPLKDIMLIPALAGAIDRANEWARPGSPHPQGSPNIDTFLDFKASISADGMNVEGVLRGDSFPNAEVFLLDARETAAGLLDYQTSGGVAGPLRLLSSHPLTRRASFRKRIPLQADGCFTPGGGGSPVTVREV